MAYHADVHFLETCNPELIERNAAKFARMRTLLISVEPSVTKARDGTIWESVHREKYDARLTEVRDLVTGLSEGFDKARGALLRYADEVERARQRLDAGLVAEKELDRLVSSVATAITPAAQRAEPMRRWEDIRETTGILDWIAELGMDVDKIRDQASRAYNQAWDEFGQAEVIEKAAREDCIAELKQAYEGLPDFRGEFAAVTNIIEGVAPLSTEAAQAQHDPLARLPGSGSKGGSFPVDGNAAVSPTLQRIRDLLTLLPNGQGLRLHNLFFDFSDDGCRDFIAHNKEIITAAAKESGLPPDMLAGIAWQEVGGKPYILDDITETLRRAADGTWSPITPQNLPGPMGGSPDSTSYGPMAIQIRRAAEVLGYDPSTLTNEQTDEIRSALKDPAQNIFIAAKYLENLKAESGFAQVPAEEMTSAQYQELAARYNGGPYWQSDHAQSYAVDFETHRQTAAEALR